VTPDDELRGFDAGARLAVALADVEARQLGHRRVGTEHLFLGLLAEGSSRAAAALRSAGVPLEPARAKVGEAVGDDTDDVDAGAPGDRLPRTARATRALGRAHRFAHGRRAEQVSGEDVLLGVLDVEGRAGQVLRGLGVDLDRLEASLLGEPDTTPEPVAPAPPLCPGCHADLRRELVHRPMTARGESGPKEVTVLSCGACGRFLAATP
jgi:ATP-dependent Clp protease ATP-binding subunit ClpA